MIVSSVPEVVSMKILTVGLDIAKQTFQAGVDCKRARWYGIPEHPEMRLGCKKQSSRPRYYGPCYCLKYRYPIRRAR
jgi:hypothetical protein